MLDETQVLELNSGKIHSKPNRFARLGNIVVLSYPDENKLLIKDLGSGQTEVVVPSVYEKQVGQQLLRIDMIHSA